MCRPTGGQWEVPVPSARCIPPPAVTPVSSLPAHRYDSVVRERQREWCCGSSICSISKVHFTASRYSFVRERDLFKAHRMLQAILLSLSIPRLPCMNNLWYRNAHLLLFNMRARHFMHAE